MAQTGKRALITGITGQDGAYLTEFLLEKGYQVHGTRRKASYTNTARIDHLYSGECSAKQNVTLHYSDLTDSSSLIHLLQSVQPDEIYNLAAQSHVGVSFESPEFTANVNALGTLRILEAIRILGMEKQARFYQASTSELYGLVRETPQSERTPFYPRSPYGVSKLFAYWITVNYRESYDIFACNGILFNHESPRRGELFVTRKITRAVAQIAHGVDTCLYLGNLDAKRDWGHAKDYVRAQWLMLQQDRAQDYVIATGEQYSVRYFVEKAFECVGVEIVWEGEGLHEVGRVRRAPPQFQKLEGKVVVAIDPRFLRPAEVETLLGDPTRAQTELNWKPEYSFEDLVSEMVESDIRTTERYLHGHKRVAEGAMV